MEETSYTFFHVIKDSGTIMLRAFTNAKTDKQYFFEGKNTNQTLGLYRNENDKLCLDLDGKVVESSYRFNWFLAYNRYFL